MFKGFRGASGGGGAGPGSQTVIVPDCMGVLDGAANSFGIECAVSRSATGRYAVLFDTAQTDTDYSVFTDPEFQDDATALQVTNKTVTGFDVDIYEISTGNYIDRRSALLVYSSSPSRTVAGPGGGSSVNNRYHVTKIGIADSPYTASAHATQPDLIVVDTSGGSVVINLPAASSNVGHVFRVKDGTGNSAANPITINCAVDGSQSTTVQNNRAATVLIDDGVEYGIN